MSRTPLKKCGKTGKTMFVDEREAKRALSKIRSNPSPAAIDSGRIPDRSYRCEHCGRWHLTHQESRARDTITHRPAPLHEDLTPEQASERDRLSLERVVRDCIADGCGTCMHHPEWGLYRIRRELGTPSESDNQTTINHESEQP